MSDGPCQIGIVGLGTMGRNFALNLIDHKFLVAAYDKDADATSALLAEASGSELIAPAYHCGELADLLRKPRAIIIFVPSGAPVDEVIVDLRPHLGKGDVIIDAGNSNFHDTERRFRELSERGLQMLGVGFSGGARGARYGPSIMPGGPKDAYDHVRPLLEAVAARVDDQPCVSWIGPRSAGHYVKMVHNGIEYALMQTLAECYDILKRGLGFDNDRLAETFERWNAGPVSSYLVETAAEIFRHSDERTGRRLIDMILDEAGQLGTGMWTSQSTLELHVPAPTIDVSVAMRDMSFYRRRLAGHVSPIKGPGHRYGGSSELLERSLAAALEAGMILAYAQGFAALHAASTAFEYSLELPTIARIWRGGCIIRSVMLREISEAFARDIDLPDLLADEKFAKRLEALQSSLRRIVATSAELGIPTPAFGASLAYLDSHRSTWLPANLIEAQRDYFGGHGYRRVDEDGIFHTDWVQGIIAKR
ncbi:MAG: NADP-dependent phosphogluconate dehydrogenase [Planctomycetaceae bacterium]|nr:NADP-dependent phosphogluconate dehydrogenase [Planctomycetaceae bacterium]